MDPSLLIRCQCGRFAGTAGNLSPETGLHMICYCDDCQAFAKHLGRGDILDSHGGTAIFQTSPANLSIEQGLDRLGCLRLTPKGPLRWYTTCCHSPIGNTTPIYQMPFVGLIRSSLDAGDRSLDEQLGPVRFRSMTRYAKGDVGHLGGTTEGFSTRHVATILWRILRSRLRGDHRRSPFFDPDSGRPITEPKAVSLHEG